MTQDSFHKLEILFHELITLSPTDRLNRIQELSNIDAQNAAKLKSMFDSITHEPDFLDPSAAQLQTPIPVQIPVDGSVLLSGRYTIIECIGFGGSSTVFRARSTNPARDVAIKMLRFGLNSPQARNRFEVESKSLAKLTHPHIAHIYETGVYTHDQARIPWIAMELIPDSKTITDHIRSNQLSEQHRIELFIRVCEAIQAAHLAGVLHLDLNSSNILTDSHGYPKIIDFGLTGLVYSTSSKTTTYVGTRLSMAPEQTIYSSIPFDERTDIYALGLLLTEILTGHQLQAFPNQSDESARKLIALGKSREQLLALNTIPESYRPLIDKMLRVNPKDRYQSVAVLLEHFQTTKATTPPKFTGIKTLAFTALLLLAIGLYLRKPSHSSSPQPINTLALPPQIAIDISSDNPRNNKFSPNNSRVITGISDALDSDTQIDPIDAAELHATLADNYRISGQYDQAINQYNQAIELLTQSGTIEDRNWTLLSFADMLIFLGKAEDAERRLEQIDRGINSTPLFLLDLGIAETKIHIANNQPDRAINQLVYTLPFLNSIHPENNQARVDRMITASNLMAQTGQSSESLRMLYKAKSFVSNKFPPQSASMAFIQVEIANAQFDPATPSTILPAKNNILSAIAIFEADDDQFHALWASRQLGNIYLASGDPLNAFKRYKHAETQLQQILGQDHHETILCRAYQELAQIAIGSNTQAHTRNLNTAIRSLTDILGPNHPVIQSLQTARQRIINQAAPDAP